MTIDELAIKLGALGVRDFYGGIAPTQARAYYVKLVTRTQQTHGEGVTLSIAFDDAISRLTHLTGEVLSK